MKMLSRHIFFLMVAMHSTEFSGFKQSCLVAILRTKCFSDTLVIDYFPEIV